MSREGMDSNSEKLRLMELDLQFQDDNTSCSSSLSTAVSEDIDDLRLGAEANSFAAKQEDNEQNIKKRLVQNFVIMKENSDLYSREDMNHTFSTISSISDLIDAREGDPDSLLMGLGFAPFEGDESHRSILSRFRAATHDARALEKSQSPQLPQQQDGQSQEAHDGTAKTRVDEWLANQTNISGSATPSPHQKENSNGTKTQDTSNHHLPGQPKRVTLQRKRHRWSKSRQSSFEHLLPNLEEEESAGDVQKSDASDASSKREPPIRESSQEKVAINADTDTNATPAHTTLHEEELSKKLQKLQKQQGFDLQDAEPIALMTETSVNPPPDSLDQCVRSFNGSPELLDFDQKGEHSTDVIVQSLPVQFPVLRYLKPQELIKAKLDSFELEEIASNDSRQSPETTLQSNMQPCKSLVSMKPMVLDINANKRCGNGGPFLAPQLQDTIERPASAGASSASTSESSSGFDEGLEESLQSLNLLQNCAQMEKEEEEQCTSEAVLRSQLGDFCTSRANMACAGGVAEATLRLRNKKNRRTSWVRRYHCAKSVNANTAEGRNTGLLRRRKSGVFTRSLSYSQFSIAGCSCKNVDSCVTSPISSTSETRLCDLPERRRTSSNSCFFRFNTNSNNWNRSFEIDKRQLSRYSSMPTLHQASSMSCRKFSWHSPGYDHAGVVRASTPTLMSSIAAVTNLSFKSSSSRQQIESELRSKSTSSVEVLPETLSFTSPCKNEIASSTPVSTYTGMASPPLAFDSNFYASSSADHSTDLSHMGSCRCTSPYSRRQEPCSDVEYPLKLGSVVPKVVPCSSKNPHGVVLAPFSSVPNGALSDAIAKHSDCSETSRTVRTNLSSKNSNDNFVNGNRLSR